MILVCVCVCVCVFFIELHTNNRAIRPCNLLILFYSILHVTHLGGYFSWTYSWLQVNAPAYSYNFNKIANKMRTYFEMGTDGHRFFMFSIRYY